MKRRPGSEELHLWARVAATVRPLPGRMVPQADESPPPPARPAAAAQGPLAFAAKPAATPQRQAPPSAIEPGRKRRIMRERDTLEARIDLHGMDQDRARAALEAFLVRAWTDGYRAALVITGKGVRGEGVLRRSAPEWLAGPALRDVVAGVSEAHRRHGGEGALYVALKRRPRD